LLWSNIGQWVEFPLGVVPLTVAKGKDNKHTSLFPHGITYLQKDFLVQAMEESGVCDIIKDVSVKLAKMISEL
jgi:hypothetical protein